MLMKMVRKAMTTRPGFLATGAAVMYLFDPDRGRSRRAELQQRAEAMLRRPLRATADRAMESEGTLLDRLDGTMAQVHGGRSGPPLRGETTMATTAREIMTRSADYIKADSTATEAARRFAENSIGALPVCDETGHLRGVVTDRDIVVEVLAAGKDPSGTPVIELVHGEAVTIGADDSIEEAIQTMKQHKLRRLPVIDGTKLVGMVSQADIARACPPDRTGELVAAISRD